MSEGPDLPARFLPFADALGDRVTRELSLRTLPWAEAHGVFAASGREHPEGLVVVASVFARLCAPPAPSERCLDVVARLLVLFFCIDDAENLDVPDLVGRGAEWSLGPLTPGLHAWLAELPELETCPPSLRESFTTSFHAYLGARRREASLSGELTLDEHWSLRRRTIFVDPYIDLWLIAMAVDTERFQRSRFAEAQRLAIDIVLLANDLGSLDGDRAGGDSRGEPNLVTAYARARGLPHDEAIEWAIAHHNELVATFGAEIASARRAERSPHADAHADILAGTVCGNLATMWTLTFRYRGVDAILTRLDRVA
jgi:hypothetical protein